MLYCLLLLKHGSEKWGESQNKNSKNNSEVKGKLYHVANYRDNNKLQSLFGNVFLRSILQNG